MDDCYDCCDEISTYSEANTSYLIEDNRHGILDDTGDSKYSRQTLASTSQTVRTDEDISLISRATATNVLKKVGANQQFQNFQPKNITSTEPFCHVKLGSIIQLKDSTKKLLCLLEDIQFKSKVKQPQSTTTVKTWKRRALVNPIPQIDINSMTEVCSSALKRLETQTKILESITTADEDDDCSVYKKLARKCNCLNQHEYNDLVIQFNEQTKFFTNTSGEIIKNLRIVKKFLYMGGDYTKHALMFLNEGLNDSSYSEKVEIIQGCAYTDICNVFEDISLVISTIAWPYKYDSYGDSVTQELAATFLRKLSQVEEGRRYLKFTTKISNDIKKVFRLKGSKLAFSTVDSLHATLNALDPQNSKENVSVAYHCRPGDEGFGTQTINDLLNYRRYMTMTEIFTHLDLLKKLSSEPNGRKELTKWIGALVALFKDMLAEYDDSEMNIIVTNILNNLLTKDMIVQEEPKVEEPKVLIVADIATEPIVMKSVANQIPLPKNKKSNRIKSNLRVTTKRNVHSSNLNFLNKSAKHEGKTKVIVVPREK